MLKGQKKLIRPLPRKIPKYCNFIICTHIMQRKSCSYTAGNCQFAHSQQEVEVWTWMVKNNGRSGICFVLLSNIFIQLMDGNSSHKKTHVFVVSIVGVSNSQDK